MRFINSHELSQVIAYTRLVKKSTWSGNVLFDASADLDYNEDGSQIAQPELRSGT